METFSFRPLGSHRLPISVTPKKSRQNGKDVEQSMICRQLTDSRLRAVSLIDPVPERRPPLSWRLVMFLLLHDQRHGSIHVWTMLLSLVALVTLD